jgi:flagellar basal-body rod protein FlgC
MDLTTSLKICGSGLAAQRAKLDIVTSNLANVSTTRTPEGGPYRKKTIVLSSEAINDNFDAKLRDILKSVKIDEIKDDPNGIKMVHDPAHPDADAKGFVAMPNINIMVEMADMITASRAYEACVTAFDATKSMTLKTLEMGRQ